MLRMNKMMRRLVQLLIVSMMFTPLGSMAGESSDGTCADFWHRTGPLREIIIHGVVPVLGQLFVVEKLTVKSLHRQDGSQFLPGSIRENNCYFDRVLSPEVRTALVEAARSAILANRGADPESLYDAISDATKRRLKKLLRSEDGLLDILSYYEWRLHIVGFGYFNRGSDVGSLERDAYSRGVYSDPYIMTLLWLSYLEYRGVNGVGPAIQYIKSQDAEYAPPSTLIPSGCRGGIRYSWPTISPSREAETVHWGICSATGQPWMYQYAMGWKEAPDEEIDWLCRDPDEPVARICKRR
jgi:hypothetical protein